MLAKKLLKSVEQFKSYNLLGEQTNWPRTTRATPTVLQLW